VYKGRLHYIARFVPAIALKGVVLEGGMNKIQCAANRMRHQDDDDATSNVSSASLSSLDEPDTAIPPVITVKRPIDGTPKTLSQNDTMDSGQTAVMNNKAENAEKHLVQMSKEELLQECVYELSLLSSC
jgi:hypothetical protein